MSPPRDTVRHRLRAPQAYSRASVRELSTEQHPLVIVQGAVYDLTDFIASHPGGSDILRKFHGEDVTRLMQGTDEDNLDVVQHEHSKSAYNMLREYCIGRLVDDDEKGTTEEDCVLTSPAHNNNSNPNDTLPSVSIDYNRAVFAQMWNLKLNREDYLRLVHTPHHLPFVARFFDNPFLEILSRNPWWVVPLVWIPVIAYVLSNLVAVHRLPAGEALACVVCYLGGVLSWTLIEYLLHRFFFHMDENLPDLPVFNMIHFTLHGVHHMLPMDRYVLSDAL